MSGHCMAADAERGVAKHADAMIPRALAATPKSALSEGKASGTPWAEKLVRLLDEALRIPGTSLQVGLDPVIGLLMPGAGDAITGVGSIALLLLALRERVPTVAILRMVMNIAIDTVLGALPIAGDVFDLFFRSNRRNLEILEKYRGDPRARPSPVDYLVVGGGLVLALASVALPIFVVWGVGFGALYALWRAIAGG